MKIKNWPVLSFAKAKDTYLTIHLWIQILGKIKIKKLPWINHSWHVTLYVTPEGLTTRNIPYNDEHFEINFDFLQHQLHIRTSNNAERKFALEGLSVAAFYKKLMDNLNEMGIHVTINQTPNELEEVIPFQEDDAHNTYIPKHASDLHLAFLNANEIFMEFRSRFTGKCSPVHLFWGSFDLAVSRFSGEKAPLHPGGVPHLPDWVAQEAYSHEVYSCGFWPGNEAVPFAAFYAYIYPEPAQFCEVRTEGKRYFYDKNLGEYLLPYSEVQKSDDPVEMVLDFLQTTYEAAAKLAKWDREKLEK